MRVFREASFLLELQRRGGQYQETLLYRLSRDPGVAFFLHFGGHQRL